MNELISKVIDWAAERGLLANSTPEKQFLKLSSEYGELCESFLDDNDVEDDIGDMVVVLTIICRLKGYDISKIYEEKDKVLYGTCYQAVTESGVYVGQLGDAIFKEKEFLKIISSLLSSLDYIANHYETTVYSCLKIAYEEIVNRKGINLDGKFIRETDPDYEGALAVLAARRVHEEV